MRLNKALKKRKSAAAMAPWASGGRERNMMALHSTTAGTGTGTLLVATVAVATVVAVVVVVVAVVVVVVAVVAAVAAPTAVKDTSASFSLAATRRQSMRAFSTRVCSEGSEMVMEPVYAAMPIFPRAAPENSAVVVVRRRRRSTERRSVFRRRGSGAASGCDIRGVDSGAAKGDFAREAGWPATKAVVVSPLNRTTAGTTTARTRMVRTRFPPGRTARLLFSELAIFLSFIKDSKIWICGGA